MIKLKRIYETPTASDGERILIDRLWPRGMSKKTAKVELWMKDIGPSSTLRRWFHHDPAKWQEFRRRYKKELQTKGDLLKVLRAKGKKNVTLVFSSRNEKHNNAVVLKEVLSKK